MTLDIIKICGISTPETVDAVINGGATHLGMIFFEKSPRHLDLKDASELSAHIGRRIAKVAVTVNANDEYHDAVVNAARPDLLQLHGSETPERVTELKQRHGLPVIKAFAVRDKADLECAKAFVGVADYFLFDAKAPAGSEIPGGNGVAFDWEIMDHWPKDVPYILSGGLNVMNISDAITKSGANGIDISSGVETCPGQKDVNMIQEFLGKIIPRECVT